MGIVADLVKILCSLDLCNLIKQPMQLDVQLLCNDEKYLIKLELIPPLQ